MFFSPMIARDAVDEFCDILTEPGIAGIDFETTVSRLYDREACTVQVAHENGREAVVYCYRQPEVLSRLMRAVADSPCTLVAHFAIFEAEMLTKLGGMPRTLECTYIAARVLRGLIPGNDVDPGFALEDLARNELGVELMKSTRDRDWRLPLDEEAHEYCLQDSRMARDLWILYADEFGRDPEQWRGYRIIADALPAIAECNLNGLVFDADGHQRMCVEHEDAAEGTLFELDLLCAGKIANHNSATQVSKWLAEEVSFEPGCTVSRASMLFTMMTGSSWKTTATGFSLDKDYLGSILDAIEPYWPHIGEYLRARMRHQKITTILKSFGASLRGKIDPDGHIRGSLIPHGARTSRMSCRDPNLQNQPAEDTFRRMYRALAGRKIVQADYSQIELRVGAIICQDRAMQRVFIEGLDIHAATACAIHNLPAYDASNRQHVKWRKLYKPVTFASLYGAMAPTVALNAGVSLVEAEKLLSTWLAIYTGVAAYRDSEPARARARGYSQLVSGQRIKAVEGSRPAQLINAPVQGSAASVMYLAMTYVHRALHERPDLDAKLALVVHDEVLIDSSEAAAPEVAKLLEDAMTRALVDLYPQVRHMGMDRVADAAILDNWGDK